MYVEPAVTVIFVTTAVIFAVMDAAAVVMQYTLDAAYDIVIELLDTVVDVTFSMILSTFSTSVVVVPVKVGPAREA